MHRSKVVMCGVASCIVLFAAASYLAPRAIAQAVKAALIRSVDEPGRAPYQVSEVFGLGVVNSNATCSGFTCVVSFPSIPAGKRLVIKNVSGDMIVTNANGVQRVILTIQTNASPVTFYLPAVLQASGAGGINFFELNQPVTAYADAENPVVFYVYFTGAPGSSSITNPNNSLTVSGYLVDLP